MKITYLSPRSYLLLTVSLCISFAASILETGAAETVKAPPATADRGDSEKAVKSSDSSNEDKAPPATDSNAQATTDAPATDTKDAASVSASKKAANDESSAEDESDQRSDGNVTLKPGQKLKIEGFSERKRAVIVDEKPAETAAYHRVQMRLTGSMCIACLHEFKDKLMQIYGVERAKIEKSETPSLQMYSPDVGNYAEGIVYFDTSRVDLLDLRAYMRILGYHSYKVIDRAAETVPPEGQKKI